MSRKYVKRSKFRNEIVMILPIIFLNSLGISYAFWNDGLKLSSTINTGSIKPVFSDTFTLEDINGNGNLTVRVEDESTIIIEGEINQGYNAALNYGVINKGSIPIKFTQQKETKTDGLNLQLNQQSSILMPNESFPSQDINTKLQIQAGKEGNYSFNTDLFFEQCTN